MSHSTSTDHSHEQQTDRNLALELVRVTEAAALAASRWMGLGKKNEADGAAVEAMRKAFDAVAIDGTVVIGEGEMDEAPMLYIGEKVGRGGPEMDIAVDPLEGTTLTAKGGPERADRDRAGREGQLPPRARHLHAEDRGRRPACRRVSWTSTIRRRRTCATSRAPSAATSPTWSPASSTATATRR